MKIQLSELKKQIAPLPYKRVFDVSIYSKSKEQIADIFNVDKPTAAYLVHCANQLPKLIEVLEFVINKDKQAIHELKRMGIRYELSDSAAHEKMIKALEQASEVEL